MTSGAMARVLAAPHRGGSAEGRFRCPGSLGTANRLKVAASPMAVASFHARIALREAIAVARFAGDVTAHTHAELGIVWMVQLCTPGEVTKKFDTWISLNSVATCVPSV